MYKTKSKLADLKDDSRLSTDAEGLAEMLGCGRSTAVKIGTAAGARLVCGKRTLYFIPKVRAFLEAESGE